MNKNFNINKFGISFVFVILCFILFFTEYGEAKSKKEKEKNVTPNIKIELVVEELPSKMEPVLLGIERVDEYQELFAGKRVGLITNPTGISRDFRSSIEILSKSVNLVALYGPEHGVRGNVAAGDYIAESTDPVTGLPVRSLYGKTKKPTAEMLRDVDILAIDIQDVGTRYYTYTSTLAYAMIGAKEQGKMLVVFDRPNPLGGMIAEGEVLKPGYESFIGLYPTPVRHGLTIGEWAKYINETQGINCDLVVLPMKNWHRGMMWRDTGFAWVPTSPNVPTANTALLYPGTGMIGSTGLSNGIGTTLPFELIGTSNFVVAEAIARDLNEWGLEGFHFRPAYFTPRGGTTTYSGIQIHITEPSKIRPIRAMLHMMDIFYKHNEKSIQFFTGNGERKVDIVVGSPSLRIHTPGKWKELIPIWEKEANEFREKTRPFWLYPESLELAE